LNAGYFWWEAGAMWGSLMDYWYYTGDTTYNAITSQGMLFQAGERDDYLPQNQTTGMGNDDQGKQASQHAQSSSDRRIDGQTDSLCLDRCIHT
jgi:hypothetical protein